MTLTEFLLARIAEDQAKAEEAQANDRSNVFEGDILGDPEPWGSMFLLKRGATLVSVLPRRVLAECSAHRQIVELHRAVGSFGFVDCRSCRDTLGLGQFSLSPNAWPCDTLKLLAQPFSDHPDFNPAWAIGVTA